MRIDLKATFLHMYAKTLIRVICFRVVGVRYGSKNEGGRGLCDYSRRKIILILITNKICT